MAEPFNANDHEPMRDFDAIPAGDYLVFPYSSEVKRTKAGTGRYLNLTWEVIDGDFKGRKLWSRLNLDNPNEKAVQIANGELSSICRATGIDTLADKWDPIELNGRTLVVKVNQVPSYNGDGMTNEVKGYLPASGTTPIPASQKIEKGDSTAPAPAPASAANGNGDEDDLPF